MITCVDYHAGNIGSIKNMLLRLGVPCLIFSQIKDIEEASHLILPGVGSFDCVMRKLQELGTVEKIRLGVRFVATVAAKTKKLESVKSLITEKKTLPLSIQYNLLFNFKN